MTATLAACALLLRCLCLGEAATVGPLLVARSSLCGYTVICGAVRAHGLGEAEAAAIVARAAALAAALAAAGQNAAPLHEDLLKAPAVDGLDRLVHETWRPGAAVQRRLSALRRRSNYVTQRLTRGQVEITYPQGTRAPAIEAVS